MKKLLLIPSLVFSVFSFSQMTTVGNAIPIGGGCNQFQLTPPATNDAKGAIWTQTAIDLNNDFDMTFEVWFQSELSGLFAADGMAFVLQQNSTGIGDHGSGMGFASPFGAPPISGNQIAIELDIFDNGGSVPSDDSNDHLGINSGGGKNHDMVAATAFPGNQIITDGAWHEFRVVWQSGFNTLLVFWEGSVVPNISLMNDIVANEFGGNPMVYWGFTAGTGGIPCQMQVRAISSPSFTSDLSTLCPGGDVAFTDGTTSPVGNPVTWAWDFGDGSAIDNTQNPTHTYVNPGSQTVTLTVSDGFCDTTATATIMVYDSVVPVMDSVSVTCFGDTDGQAIVSSSSGDAPFGYLWNDTGAQTGATATNLDPGVYTVTITDNNGCVGTDSVEVAEPLPITLAMDSSKTLCYGDSLGYAVVAPTDGVAPYTYQWDDYASQTTDTANALPAGMYTVIVTDDNGCTATDSVEVVEHPEITGSGTTTPDNGTGNGTINFTASGGIPPYTYLWDNGDTLANIDSLTMGSYTVTVSDSTGCEEDFTFVVGSSVGYQSLADAGFLFYPNPSNGAFTIKGNGDYEFIVRDMRGRTILSESATDIVLVELLNVDDGMYLLTIVKDGQEFIERLVIK